MRARGAGHPLIGREADLTVHREIGLAVCTRFLRTRETVDLALDGRIVPLVIEPDLDEINSGAFDGAPMRAYWAWREQHSSSERFPGGESLDEAVRRYAEPRRLFPA
jgi:broad specificity phosphatase PhoE